MAEFLRRHVIFKVVPIINPDSVALGNYRTGLSGRDLTGSIGILIRKCSPKCMRLRNWLHRIS